MVVGIEAVVIRCAVWIGLAGFLAEGVVGGAAGQGEGAVVEAFSNLAQLFGVVGVDGGGGAVVITSQSVQGVVAVADGFDGCCRSLS